MNAIKTDGSMNPRPRHGYWAVVRRCVVGVALLIACQSALAQAMYRIKPIGDLPGGCNRFPVGLTSMDERSDGHYLQCEWRLSRILVEERRYSDGGSRTA